MSESLAIVSPDIPLNEPALRALIDQAPDGIFVADIAGRYIYVNDAGCRMLGYSREEMLGQTILDSIPAKDAGRLARSKAMMLQGRTHAAEWTLRRKDGSWLAVEVNANILPSGQWQGFVRDISERKMHQAEREALFARIESDRRRLKTVLETFPLGVLLFEPGGTVTANRRTEELLGMKLTPEAGNAQYADHVFRPDGRPVPVDELLSSRALRGTTVVAEEFIVRRPDGTEIPVLASGAPIHDREGIPIGAVAVFQDMSERMRLEQSFRENERLLKGVFDILPVGVWIADASGHIRANNPAAERIWGGARHVGLADYGSYRGWWVDSGKPIAAEEWALARAVRQGETSIGELVRIQCFDGSLKTIINSAAPLRDESGAITGAIVVNEDITPLHQTQEQLRAAVRDREDILAVVTHDLRNPLSVIMTMAATLELKARALDGGEPIRAMAANLTDIAQQMTELVNDLMAAAILGSDRPVLKTRPVKAFALLEKAASSARPLFALEGIGFEVQVIGELPVIHVDANRVLRVFANLLDNARKFTEPGGKVVLRAEAQTAGVRFCVANSGPALSATELERMFHPFWQSGRDAGGTGLGLSICRSIVQAHGGSIWAEPMAGQRVRVCVLLPSASAPPLAPAPT